VRRLATVVGSIVGLVLSAPILACTPAPGYRIPTNLELVSQADVIAIARVRSGPDVSAIKRSVMEYPTTKFDLLRLLKGKTHTMWVEEEGLFLMKSPPGLSNPRELRFAHPSAYAGYCTRSFFVSGSTVLLFLQRDKAGKLRIMDLPFARVSEDVQGDRSLWLKAVREYLAMSALPKAQWPAAPRARQEFLRHGQADRDAIAIATNMARLPGEDEDYSSADAKRMGTQGMRFWKALEAEAPAMRPSPSR
jgi:hypothetical protein